MPRCRCTAAGAGAVIPGLSRALDSDSDGDAHNVKSLANFGWPTSWSSHCSHSLALWSHSPSLSMMMQDHAGEILCN